MEAIRKKNFIKRLLSRVKMKRKLRNIDLWIHTWAIKLSRKTKMWLLYINKDVVITYLRIVSMNR